MECRAKNAEKESELLKVQLEGLKEQLDKVTILLFHLYVVYALLSIILVS